MKRVEQLVKLSREHHVSLVMAKKYSDIAENGTEEELRESLEQIKEYYNSELEEHFQHEERTIFAPIFSEYKEHIGIATILLKEHGHIRKMIPLLNIETAREDLAEFGEMLKNHTRMEERELFPIIQTLFTTEQLDAILNFVALD